MRNAGCSRGGSRWVRLWLGPGEETLQQGGAGAPRLGRRSPAFAGDPSGLNRNPDSHLKASSSRK